MSITICVNGGNSMTVQGKGNIPEPQVPSVRVPGSAPAMKPGAEAQLDTTRPLTRDKVETSDAARSAGFDPLNRKLSFSDLGASLARPNTAGSGLNLQLDPELAISPVDGTRLAPIQAV